MLVDTMVKCTHDIAAKKKATLVGKPTRKASKTERTACVI